MDLSTLPLAISASFGEMSKQVTSFSCLTTAMEVRISGGSPESSLGRSSGRQSLIVRSREAETNQIPRWPNFTAHTNSKCPTQTAIQLKEKLTLMSVAIIHVGQRLQDSRFWVVLYTIPKSKGNTYETYCFFF